MGSVPIERIRKTPLVLQGMILELLRLHFSVGASPQYLWAEDITETKVVIEPIHKLDFDVVQKRPAIYVSRGALQYPTQGGHLAFNDANLVNPIDGILGQKILVSCPIQIIPVDRRAAAVERLAEEISEVLLVFKTLIREDYDFLRFDLAGIAPVGYVQEDREYFTAPLTVHTQWAEAWEIKQLSSKVRHIMVELRSALEDPRGEAGLPPVLGRPFSGTPDSADPCNADSKFCTLPPDDLRGVEAEEPAPDKVDPDGYGKGHYGD